MQKFIIYIFTILVITISLTYSCAPRAIPETGLKESPGPAALTPQKISWEAEWEKTIANAKDGRPHYQWQWPELVRHVR